MSATWNYSTSKPAWCQRTLPRIIQPVNWLGVRRTCLDKPVWQQYELLGCIAQRRHGFVCLSVCLFRNGVKTECFGPFCQHATTVVEILLHCAPLQLFHCPLASSGSHPTILVQQSAKVFLLCLCSWMRLRVLTEEFRIYYTHTPV